uniref:Uncharacterized protein n=1 Tax=Chlamydomonas euryale TaxID=1486919 RepID=A0A7R9YYS9_9CHLO
MDTDMGVERAKGQTVADLPMAWDDREAVDGVGRAQSVQLKAGGAGGERRVRVDAKQRRRREALRRMLDGMEAHGGDAGSSGGGGGGEPGSK